MGHTKDISSKESKANKKKYAEMAQKLREKAPAAAGRPLNWMEQQSLQTIFAIGEFPDVAKGVLGPRLDTIHNSKQRLGIIQWAARSLFEDCVKQLTPDQANRFVKAAQVMRCEVHPAGISKAPRTKDETIVNCQDLYTLVESVYRHECMMCSKKRPRSQKMRPEESARCDDDPNGTRRSVRRGLLVSALTATEGGLHASEHHGQRQCDLPILPAGIHQVDLLRGVRRGGLPDPI